MKNSLLNWRLRVVRMLNSGMPAAAIAETLDCSTHAISRAKNWHERIRGRAERLDDLEQELALLSPSRSPATKELDHKKSLPPAVRLLVVRKSDEGKTLPEIVEEFGAAPWQITRARQWAATIRRLGDRARSLLESGDEKYRGAEL